MLDLTVFCRVLGGDSACSQSVAWESCETALSLSLPVCGVEKTILLTVHMVEDISSAIRSKKWRGKNIIFFSREDEGFICSSHCLTVRAL